MTLFLGLDASTQSLTGIVIDVDRNAVVCEHAINFGARLPQFQSPHGFLPHTDPRVRHADPLMWVAALELLLTELRTKVDLSRIAGVSGAGQQHGSVYLSDAIPAWSRATPLVEQVRPLLSRKTAPIWMDSSTSVECAELTQAVGGRTRMLELTGSLATERFTGPQIKKLAKDDPAIWARTKEVQLVSSFMASLLAGKSAAIDFGDGAGMNLLELQRGTWNHALLEATAPELRSRLRAPVASTTIVGPIADYFVSTHGFSPGTPIVTFTGDNPSSLIGMGAASPGVAVVSLGTSDTLFAAMPSLVTDASGSGNVFGNPAGGFMALQCFANGSLAREAVRDRAGLDWAGFARAIVERTKPGNDGNMLLPYFVPEISPHLGKPAVRWFGSADFVAGRDGAAAARAVVEAQASSMRLHARWIGHTPTRVLVTGGGARNPGILRVFADVFQAEILPIAVSNSSALGGALRAANVVAKRSFEELGAAFAVPDLSRRSVPQESAKPIYDALGAALEERIAALIAEQL